MKKVLIAVLAMFVLTLSSTVSAKEHRHDWSHSEYKKNNWHQVHSMPGKSMPFKWYENHRRFSSSAYRMERVHDRELSNRFPGLHAYKWQDKKGKGFWYNGHYIKDAVLFYNRSDELVSVGFMHNGVFIFVRDDNNTYRNHDSFFLAWMMR